MLELKEFQQETVNELIDFTLNGDKENILLSAPTGAGKTIVLTEYMNKLVEIIPDDLCFLWFTPGQGELEQQSYGVLEKKNDIVKPNYLADLIQVGARLNSCYYINYEQIIKNNNKFVKSGESSNFYDRIEEVKGKCHIILIVDEEHLNDTLKVDKVIERIDPALQIRVSATPGKKEDSVWHKIIIEEEKVIDSGLITKKTIINENLMNAQEESSLNEIELLLKLAVEKREQIKLEYSKLGKKINPLVLVQLPNNVSKLPDEYSLILDFLQKYNYFLDNGTVGIWLDKEKVNINNISDNDSPVCFLMCKQAITTGWDCKRAKILVKLRTNTTEKFEIQTIGRIRRMPESIHYNNEILDTSYIYTLDNEFEIFSCSDPTTYLQTNVSLKEEYKNFSLPCEHHYKPQSEYLDGDFIISIKNKIKNILKLTNDTKMNRKILLDKGFDFSSSEIKTFSEGTYISRSKNSIRQFCVDKDLTEADFWRFKNIVDKIGSKLKVPNWDRKFYIIKSLFANNEGILNFQLLHDLYAFFIKNEDSLVNLFDKAIKSTNSSVMNQTLMFGNIEKYNFLFPKTYKYPYNPPLEGTVKSVVTPVVNCVYNSVYNNQHFSSKCEYMFFEYIANNPNIEWWFKNLDSGKDGFCITYESGLGTIENFYPDFILKTSKGEVYIIETKGGENYDYSSKDIDLYSAMKFNALKKYAQSNNIKFAFVRDSATNKLKYSNTHYEEKLTNVQLKGVVWENIDKLF